MFLEQIAKQHLDGIWKYFRWKKRNSSKITIEIVFAHYNTSHIGLSTWHWTILVCITDKYSTKVPMAALAFKQAIAYHQILHHKIGPWDIFTLTYKIMN